MDTEPKQPAEEIAMTSSEKPSEKEWQDYKSEIENFRDQVSKKAEEVLGEDDGSNWLYYKIIDFVDEVGKNVPNFRSFIALHRLIQSGTSFANTPFLDLPSPYNIKDFCNKLLLELDNKENCQEHLRERVPKKKQ